MECIVHYSYLLILADSSACRGCWISGFLPKIEFIIIHHSFDHSTHLALLVSLDPPLRSRFPRPHWNCTCTCLAGAHRAWRMMRVVSSVPYVDAMLDPQMATPESTVNSKDLPEDYCWSCNAQLLEASRLGRHLDRSNLRYTILQARQRNDENTCLRRILTRSWTLK